MMAGICKFLLKNKSACVIKTGNRFVLAAIYRNSDFTGKILPHFWYFI